MTSLLRPYVLSLVLVVPALARSQPKETVVPVRVALVSGDTSEVVRNVLTLAEVKLSQVAGIHLLERQAIDKVLTEQKLSLAGVVAADQVVAVGKLVSVDLFAVLEAGTIPKEGGGLVIFDARTGVRLWDAALPSGELEQTVTATVDAVQAASKKRNATGKMRPVCLLTVRNADLPRGLDVFCDSVGLLMERQLVASPDLAVLERRRLEQVNKERNLPVDSPLGRLLASVVTIELDVGVAPDGKGLRATALLSDSAGKSLGKVTASVKDRNAAELGRAVAKEVAGALNVEVLPAARNPEVESHRFIRESTFLLGQADTLRSLRAAESAYALNPNGSTARMALSRSLLTHAYGLLFPDLRDRTGLPIVESDKLEISLELARRGSELLVEEESALLMPGGFFPFKDSAKQILLVYLPRIGQIRGRLTEVESAVVESIRANHNRFFDIRIDRELKLLKERDTFDKYSFELFWMLQTNETDPFLPPAEWTDLLCRLRKWADVARNYKDKGATFSHALLWRAIESYGLPRHPAESDVARLQTLWAALESHPNRVISLYGRLGGVVNSLKFGKIEGSEARSKVHTFRLFVQSILERGDELSVEDRVNVYNVANQAFANDHLLKLPGYVEEGKDLCEFMLQRNEVVARLVLMNAENHLLGNATLENQKYAYDVLQRALVILDQKKGRFLPGRILFESVSTEDVFRENVSRIQAKIRASSPTVAPPPVVPWEKVTTLLDVYSNTRGVLWLQRPVIHAGSVYVAGVRRDGNPGKHSVQLLRLTPGREEKWEGRPIEVAIRPDVRGLPVVGPNRHNLLFGTAACVDKDRYYLGSKEHGIFVFPFDNGPPEQITTADGLPSDAVQSLACLDGRLYACLGETFQVSYVVVWDLKTRKCEVLASSRRKDKRSPLDDKEPIMESTVIPDPARDRILLILFANSTSTVMSSASSTVSGIWSLDKRSGEFQQLLALNNADKSLFGVNSRVEGDRLLLSGLLGNLVFDLTKKDRVLLFDNKVTLDLKESRFSVIFNKMKALPDYRITPGAFYAVLGPHLTVNGWVWGTMPFSRRKYDTGAVDLLPPLRSGQKSFAADQGFQMFPGGKELLIGDSFGLWVVTLKKD